MDNWSKKKASKTCGGLGMSKYIDSNEARRLSRLNNIKSSIGSNTGHNGWQRQQIEKRRKEQLRQRKRDAKKKQLGDGIQVDTAISRSDAVSKCGLKLKASTDTVDVDGKARGKKKKQLDPQNEVQMAQPDLRLNRRRCDPKKQTDNEKRDHSESNLPLLKDRLNGSNTTSTATMKRNPIRRQDDTGRKYGPNQKKLPADEGKENSDNSSNNKATLNSKNTTGGDGDDFSKKTTGTLNKDHAGHHAVSGKQPVPATKKYFHMDIDSLRREHADAINMLEELDKCEGNRRRSLDSDDSSYGSAYQPVHDDSYRENNALIGEFGKNCSNTSAALLGVDDRQKEDQTMGKTTVCSELPASFLNMSHLSISLHSSFCDGGDGVINLTPTKNRSFGSDEGSCTRTKSRAFSLQEDLGSDEGEAIRRSFCLQEDSGRDSVGNEAPVTPKKNRSFTLSCASCEDSDFFGDADIDSCSSDEDGYSSGSF